MAVKSSTRALLVACLLAFGVAQAAAQNTASPLPKPTGLVNDFAGVIDPATKSQLETTLTNLRKRADIEFAVATVNTTGGQDIFDYSLAVARGWGIGPAGGEKNGLLLLVAVQDRKYFFQVSRHLEGDLPDGYAGAVGRRMRDSFRANRYGEGISLAVQTIIATLGEKRGFSVEGIDQSYALREQQQPQTRERAPRQSSFSMCGIALVIIVLIIIFSRGGGGGAGGCLNLLLLNSLLSSAGRSSGWGGSSGGWGGGGGGGGGFGGFGGGGDFGGGGAGGDW